MSDFRCSGLGDRAPLVEQVRIPWDMRRSTSVSRARECLAEVVRLRNEIAAHGDLGSIGVRVGALIDEARIELAIADGEAALSVDGMHAA